MLILRTALVLSVAACATAPAPPPTISVGMCGAPSGNAYELTIRRAMVADMRLQSTNRGALEIRVFNKRTDTTVVIAHAEISLFATSSEASSELVAGGLTTESGWWRSEGLRPGVMHLRGRAIGFLPLRETVAVRTGFRDTLELRLRMDVMCG